MLVRRMVLMIARLLPVVLAEEAERDDGLRKRWSNVVLSSWLSILSGFGGVLLRQSLKGS